MNTTRIDSEGVSGLAERYKEQVHGVLHCYDRVIITGTMSEICHSGAISWWLRERGIKVFEFPKRVAQGWRDQIHRRVEEVAKREGVEICLVGPQVNKEKYVRAVLEKKAPKEGLVLIVKAMERCQKYRPCFDKERLAHLKLETGKCMTFYFYINDPEWGLCWVRLPGWAPFKMQVYLNGHHRLARQLRKAGIGYQQADNCFTQIDDLERAQRMADRLDVEKLHRKLDRWAEHFCPVLREMKKGYYWSVWQVEYSSDVMFKKGKVLAPVYEQLVEEAVHSVKVRDIGTFLGRRLTSRFEGEAGNRLNARVEGTRLRHQVGPAAIKMYDKCGQVLRIETVHNDVRFLSTYRKVRHRDGKVELKYAPVAKNIYSLVCLKGLMRRSNQRYYDYISSLSEHSRGVIELAKLSAPVRDRNKRPYRGFNLFDATDAVLLSALPQGEYKISGLTNRRLRQRLPGWSSSRVSRCLKRLRLHGVLRKAGPSHKYYITKRGQNVLLTLMALKERVIIPQMATT